MKAPASRNPLVEVDAVYSGATGTEDNRSEIFQRTNGTDLSFTYHAPDFFFDFVPVNAAAVDDPARHAFTSRDESFNETTQDIYEICGALAYSSVASNGEIETKVGGLFRQTDRPSPQFRRHQLFARGRIGARLYAG